MAASFPTSLPDGSVGGWLQALNMAKYDPAFAAAGVTTEQALKRMDDGSLKEIGVSMAGHRKRILLGIDSLSSAGARPPTGRVSHRPELTRRPRAAADAGCSTDIDMAGALATPVLQGRPSTRA